MITKKIKIASYSFISVTLILLSTSSVYTLQNAFGHTAIISVPYATQPVNLDGKLDHNEWSDAHKLSFKAVSNETAYIYLKYSQEGKYLYGAFTIPDSTLSDRDEVWLIFDPNHSGGGDKRYGDFILQLWRGLFTYSDTEDESNYAFLNYALTDWSSTLVTDPPQPVTSFDYVFQDSDSGWQGEFRAGIADLETEKIGLLIGQFDASEDGAEAEQVFFPETYVFGSGADYYADLIFPKGVGTNVPTQGQTASSTTIPNVVSNAKQISDNNYSIPSVLGVVAAATMLTIFGVVRCSRLWKDPTI